MYTMLRQWYFKMYFRYYYNLLVHKTIVIGNKTVQYNAKLDI